MKHLRRREPRELSSWSPFIDMDKFFGNFFPSLSLDSDSPTGKWAPPLDIVEGEEDVRVRLEVPGVSPEDIQITVTGDVLTLAGEKKSESEKEDGNLYHVERRFGSFRRDLQLPFSVDSEKVTADYKNGVLNVILKKKATEVAKKIKVELK